MNMVGKWKYNPNSMSIKYFLPVNEKTLMTSSNKDVICMINFYKNSELCWQEFN